MIFLIIGSEQAGSSISKETSTLTAMVGIVVNIKIFWSGIYLNINWRSLSLRHDDDDWIIIVLELTRQVSSYTTWFEHRQFMRGL